MAAETPGGLALQRLMLPIGLAIAALFILVAFQTVQLIRDRGTLAELKQQQEPTVEAALKARRQLENLAGKTAQLAADGNVHARAVVD